MPGMQFLEPKHVSLLCNGLKQQTTRKLWVHPITVNNKIRAYFRPRMGKGSCINCIKKDCDNSNFTGFKSVRDRVGCCDWINFFGETAVTSVYITDFEYMSSADRENWAVRDGFTCFSEADEWFNKVHGSEWKSRKWAVISFNSEWN